MCVYIRCNPTSLITVMNDPVLVAQTARVTEVIYLTIEILHLLILFNLLKFLVRHLEYSSVSVI